jgi:hypothetical protein
MQRTSKEATGYSNKPLHLELYRRWMNGLAAEIAQGITGFSKTVVSIPVLEKKEVEICRASC